MFIYFIFFPSFLCSFQGVEELTPGIKMLLKLLFKICPYVQCGLIIALIVAGLSLVGSALLSCFWLSTSCSSSALQKQRQTQKCNVLLTESSANSNKMNKINVCIVPLLPPTSPKSATAVPLEQLAAKGKGEKMATMMMLMPPQVDQQKSQSKLQQLKNKFSKKDNTLLPFLQNEFMTT